MKTEIKVPIVSNAEVTQGGFLLTFPRLFHFEPGQVIAVGLTAVSEPRLYSIASGNNDNEVSILYNIKPDGALTPALAVLKPGDMIFVSEPFGRFLCDEKPAYWIATGTGIAPFASMFYSGLGTNKILIHGNRTSDGCYFADDFLKSMGSNYIRCCSREHAGGCFPGRVTDYLNQLEQLNTNIPFYLCGSAEMVVDVRDLLIARGVGFDRIIAEIFF